jgi:trans-aconitate methyltransferase
MENEITNHWERIYETKSADEVSWTQSVPEPSFSLIKSLANQKQARIVDIGGGDSLLVDFLLADGYTDVTVVDISQHAIERAKKRLGNRSALVKWIQADIRDFVIDKHYDVWHDRAAFHFLTDESDAVNYTKKIKSGDVSNVVIGTFSKTGPSKCSGLILNNMTARASIRSSQMCLIKRIAFRWIT